MRRYLVVIGTLVSAIAVVVGAGAQAALATSGSGWTAYVTNQHRRVSDADRDGDEYGGNGDCGRCGP